MFAKEDASGLLLPVKGLVTVELRDADTGRVAYREQTDNFLSLQTLAVSRWWQRMIWGAFNPIETNDAAGVKPTEMPWLPAWHLGYWNDATAESSATEDFIKGDLVGWASRHPVGSPSGKRGVVNITESEFKDAYSKWVFDWTTSQGNGTFQSIGWTKLDERIGIPIPRFPDDAWVNVTGAGGNLAGGGSAWWDGTLWNSFEYNTGGSVWRLTTYAATGGVSTNGFNFPGTMWSSAIYPMGLAKIGTDFITAGYNTTGPRPRLSRVNNAGTQVWLRDEAAITAQYRDVTVDASNNIWTIGSDNIVRRHSNADGTITASFTPALNPTVSWGIAFDPADGNFWVMGTFTAAPTTYVVWKMDNSGNTVGPLYSLAGVSQTITSTAPYAGSYVINAAASRETYALVFGTANAAAASTGMFVGRAPTLAGQGAGLLFTLAMKGADLWVTQGQNSFLLRLCPLRGGTLGTRSRLGSPVTKTSSQTLKITYQFNY